MMHKPTDWHNIGLCGNRSQDIEPALREAATEIERLVREIRAHRARCLGSDGLGGDFDDWEQAGRRLWAALEDKTR